MKCRLLIVLLCLMAWATEGMAQTPFVNLTPKPKQMTVSEGQLTLPSDFVVSYTDADAAMVDEMNRFVQVYNVAAGAQASVAQSQQGALLQVVKFDSSAKRAAGAYKVKVTADQVKLTADDALGLFYAFQTVKKMLPANVMAGVYEAKNTVYALPLVDITDEPRFEYRGFMLDVARHFFTVEEVKRMLDIMAYYKMNRFHWHLSDDQGWRVEIKKYPKLTSVGSIAPNVMFTDMYTCTQYWKNEPYGPYFYTQDEIRDVVAYAQNLHIEIVPEIDMPGHFVAAMASYPEYSCYPNGNHTIWSTGGISSDVLNVANPAAVQFAKDILEELIELFPYETIHIGGDECPTSAWEGNAECQARYQELGLTNYRQLQSHFIKEMADFVQSKGRKLAVWNEAITAGSADTETVKSTGALVYCWTGPEAAARKAAELGLKNIYTPWGPYYINRRQGTSPLDPPGAGDGTDDVRKTYNQAIPSETDYGVQGTFWTEHVSDREYMEWLALPRLIAIAEAGWTPQANRDFEDFRKRMSADTVLLNYGDYRFCKYYMLGEEGESDMEMPLTSNENKQYYYRLISGSTDTRKDRCMELVAEGSPLLDTYADKNIAVGRLWTNTQAAEGDANYDCQWWRLEEDPANPGKYALVCKAMPGGSVKPNPTTAGTGGRWDYDNETKHYNFVLGAAAYGTKGDNHYYSIGSDQLDGWYMNSSLGGQGMAVNAYGNPNDGAGGQWQFDPMEDYGGSNPQPITFEPLEDGVTYVFSNSVDGFDHTALADNGTANLLVHSTDAFAANAWRVAAVSVDEATGVQTLRLQNVGTDRYVGTTNSYVDRQGFPVTVSSTAADVQLSYEPATGDYRLKVNGHSLFPLPNGQVNSGATIRDASYDAPRLQGAGWNILKVRVVTFNCVDDQGNDLGTFTRSIDAAAGEPTAALCPTFKNTEVQGIEETGENTYRVTYKRSAFSVVLRMVDQRGAIIEEVEQAVPVGGSYTVSIPEVKYYTFESSSVTDGTVIAPTADQTIECVFTSDAYPGVKRAADLVTDAIQKGNSYLFYDSSDADGGARRGYRKIVADTKVINRATEALDLDPSATWTVEQSGSSYKIKNEYYGLYVPSLQRSTAAVASKTGGLFTFNKNSDGTSWNIKCSNGQYWDGTENGNLVGWDGGTGHPIQLYRYYVQPYFVITVVCTDESGTELQRKEALLKAGESYTLTFPELEGFVLKSVEGDEGYEGVADSHRTVTATYGSPQSGIDTAIDTAEASHQGIYDLQGRRLSRIQQQGIYLIHGKKVLIR